MRPLTPPSSFAAPSPPPPPPRAAAFPHHLLVDSPSASLRRLLPPLHALALVLGLAPSLAPSLLRAYSDRGDLSSARKVFDAIPRAKKSVVPFSALIGALSRSDDPDSAFSLCNQMRRLGVAPNSVTFLSLLSGASCARRAQCVHASAIHYGFFDADLVLANSMVSVYAKCGRVDTARKVFDLMPLRDAVSWNSMLLGYARNGCVDESIDLCRRMRFEGIYPDQQAYGSLVISLTNCAEELLEPIKTGRQVHALVVSSGFCSDARVETALISMYLRFGSFDDAFMLFDRASDKDVVSWSAMISGLVQNSKADEALIVFYRMLSSRVVPAPTTIACALSACAQLGLLKVGASIHGYIVRQRFPMDISVENSLVTMYAKCDRVTQCRYVFEGMADKDLVSWNVAVLGYSQNGHLTESFALFHEMMLGSQKPDKITLVSLLQGCTSMGALGCGKVVHNFTIKLGFGPSISLDTSLVDMYSKCGDLVAAKKCFDLMPEHDLISWTAVVVGYGSHGMGELALEMYRDFLSKGLKPNEVMFLSVLSACSHSGLVSEGLKIFESMKEEFGVMPKIEHYGCIIDLLCKAGKVGEAYEILKTMTPRPNADVLGIILDSCRAHKFVDIAEAVAKEIISLEPKFAGSYVQLAHSYATIRKWDGVEKAWTKMRELGLKKAPAWSFIELDGAITSFFADHSSHPQQEEMMKVLRILDGEMRDISRSFATKGLAGLVGALAEVPLD
ncbi:pentatricopeptide repeat-containing protein At4g04370-like [Ananas comosus]|uniref:Pentatricopeptide repeat-containing protein At4g04370-like n=1 Tax=Ananas comosus TaxID=4615 RepID=A0A6P5GK02_ANACO|nr:pentatricopeptide repeat-containing protein At4g04370-like [Ananas comosus]XP_020104114.1 pentatricopeptide repeat-containing protein At4g04370-like [Ananas comosus]XP_020104880.1 pentatricopeptide repeat-containing protein At4g04370-like [Ananas comosus]XP_020105600.1 pentatricopeptide repeat-containing protein At4g04370-like [Ananas comosus]